MMRRVAARRRQGLKPPGYGMEAQGAGDQPTNRGCHYLACAYAPARGVRGRRATVIAEAVDLYEASQEQTSRQEFLAAITGLGVADVTDLSERDEEILAAEISPIRGWGLARDEHTD